MSENAMNELLEINKIERQALADGDLLPSEVMAVQRGRKLAEAQMAGREVSAFLDQNLDILRATEEGWDTFEGGMAKLDALFESTRETYRPKTGRIDVFDRAWSEVVGNIRSKFGANHAKWVGEKDLTLITNSAKEHVGDIITGADALQFMPNETDEELEERKLKTAMKGLSIALDGDQAKIAGYPQVFTGTRMNELVAEAIIGLLVSDTSAKFAQKVWDSLPTGEILGRAPGAAFQPGDVRPLLKDTTYSGQLYKANNARIKSVLDLTSEDSTPAEIFRAGKDIANDFLNHAMLNDVLSQPGGGPPSIPDAGKQYVEWMLNGRPDDPDTTRDETMVGVNQALGLKDGNKFVLGAAGAYPQGMGDDMLWTVRQQGTQSTFNIQIGNIRDAVFASAEKSLIEQQVSADRSVWERIKKIPVGERTDLDVLRFNARTDEDGHFKPSQTYHQMVAAIGAQLRWANNPVVRDALLGGVRMLSEFSDQRELLLQQMGRGDITPDQYESMASSSMEAFLEGFAFYDSFLSTGDPVLLAEYFDSKNGADARTMYEVFDFLYTKRGNLTTPESRRNAKLSAYQAVLASHTHAKDFGTMKDYHERFEAQWAAVEKEQPEYISHNKWLRKTTSSILFISQYATGGKSVTVEEALDAAIQLLEPNTTLIGGALQLWEDLPTRVPAEVDTLRHYFGEEYGSDGVVSEWIKDGRAAAVGFIPVLPQLTPSQRTALKKKNGILWEPVGTNWKMSVKDPAIAGTPVTLAGPGTTGLWSLSDIRRLNPDAPPAAPVDPDVSGKSPAMDPIIPDPGSAIAILGLGERSSVDITSRSWEAFEIPGKGNIKDPVEAVGWIRGRRLQTPIRANNEAAEETKWLEEQIGKGGTYEEKANLFVKNRGLFIDAAGDALSVLTESRAEAIEAEIAEAYPEGGPEGEWHGSNAGRRLMSKLISNANREMKKNGEPRRTMRDARAVDDILHQQDPDEKPEDLYAALNDAFDGIPLEDGDEIDHNGQLVGARTEESPEEPEPLVLAPETPEPVVEEPAEEPTPGGDLEPPVEEVVTEPEEEPAAEEPVEEEPVEEEPEPAPAPAPEPEPAPEGDLGADHGERLRTALAFARQIARREGRMFTEEDVKKVTARVVKESHRLIASKAIEDLDLTKPMGTTNARKWLTDDSPPRPLVQNMFTGLLALRSAALSKKKRSEASRITRVLDILAEYIKTLDEGG